MFSDDEAMMNKQEIINAVVNDGFVEQGDFVYVWKREQACRANGCSGCVFEQRPDSLYMCTACLDLDEIMPRGIGEANIGRFELGDKEAYRKAFCKLNQKLKSWK